MGGGFGQINFRVDNALKIGRMKRFRFSPFMFLLMALLGCAGYAPQNEMLGQKAWDIQKQLGEPTSARSLQNGGERWTYARGPYGEHTYFLDFSDDGALEAVEQVLTEKKFALVLSGMTMEQVEDILGPSKIQSQLARGRGVVRSYRYESPFCRWFQVEYTVEGLVRSAGFGFPPECLLDRPWGFSHNP